MKHAITIIVFFIISFCSCNKGKKIQGKQKSFEANKDKVNQEPIPKGDNSFNALDWQGTYKGTMRCKDCHDVDLELILYYNLTFKLTTKNSGNQTTRVNSTNGLFFWNPAGNIISLKGGDYKYNRFFVGENKLILTDQDGNRITDENGRLNLLKKIKGNRPD